MTTSMVPHDLTLDTLFALHLLCQVCEERPWTHQARYCPARICAACAESEPEPEEQDR